MRVSLKLACVVVLVLWSPRLGAQAAAPPNLATAKIVDLTHAFDEKTLYWPTSPSAFALERLAAGQTPGGWYYASNAFCTPEHGGTHLDAPVHFARDGRSTDQIPVRQLIAPAAVIDVRRQAAANPDYRLTPEDVRAYEKRHGQIAPATIVLLRTGWSTRWPDRKAYLGDDTPGDASKLHFPSYGEEAAALLVRERKVGGLGVDTASIDYGASQDYPVHRIAGAANVFGLENVTRLEELPEAGAWVIALPMKIGGGSGGPLRIVAVVP
jgi:kynurenine formamidase